MTLFIEDNLLYVRGNSKYFTKSFWVAKMGLYSGDEKLAKEFMKSRLTADMIGMSMMMGRCVSRAAID